jgi:acyl-CoA synthetase (AMP-forming)/AMP-acid ligase II/acyl carrier protein
MISFSSRSIIELIETRSLQKPNAPALLSIEHQTLTYQQLFQQVVKFSETLRSVNIGRTDRVAIILPNGPAMAMAFLGVACSATSAPLNPAYREGEFEFFFDDLRAKAVLLLAEEDSPARQVAKHKGIRILELVQQTNPVNLEYDIQVPNAITMASSNFSKAEDIALVLHTSGTTSRPKLVPLSHANLCASAGNIASTLALTPQDRCLNIMPLFHIHGLVAAVLASLTAGSSLVCTPGLDSELFFSWLEAFKPSWYTAVPTMHQMILSKALEHTTISEKSSLRFVRSSSASLPPNVMKELQGTFHAPVIEAYGMTEAAHQMASNPLPPQAQKPGSVGLPAGPEVAIMDEQGKLLPQGITGEIVIRGENVTGGYENAPAANQSSFSHGWFRTGDQGYFDPDGYLFITGRLKEMINRGGEKVAPREVDEIFLAHPAVSLAVTFAIPHPTLGEDVATAVVLKSGAVVSEKELRQFALQHLAGHKAPSQVILVDQIPKGPTGKLQRIGLYEKLAVHMKVPFIAPRNPLEENLVRIWREVLKLEQVGIQDNFFMLGGDSLLAIQIVSRIRTVFQVEPELSILFREPTIAELAATIQELILNQIENLSEEQAQRLVGLTK